MFGNKPIRGKLSFWVSAAIVITIALVGASVLEVLTVQTSYEGELQTAMEEIGADYLSVWPVSASGGRSTSHADAKAIELIAGVSAVALARGPGVFAETTVKQGEMTTTQPGFTLAPVDPEFFTIRHLQVAAGRFFDDLDAATDVAVVGHQVAQGLQLSIGDKIKHKELSRTYKVIGVLKSTDADISIAVSNLDPVDTTVFIPFDSTPTIGEVNFGSHTEDRYALLEKITLWAGVDAGVPPTSLTEEVRATLADLTGQTLSAMAGKPARIIHEYIARQTRGSLQQITMIILLIGLINISGLVMMHVFLNAKEIGIKRACGATANRISLEYMRRYFYLSLIGAMLAALLALGISPVLAQMLDARLIFKPSSWALGIVLIASIGPLTSILPAGLAGKLSPMASIRDQMEWGLGKRRFDVRHLLVSVAFGLAVGSVLFVSAYGLATTQGIDRYLRATGSELLVVSEPPLGSVFPIPRLGLADYEALIERRPAGISNLCWLTSERDLIEAVSSFPLRTVVHSFAGDLEGVRSFSLAAGTWPTAPGETALGAQVAKKLFPAVDPIGQTVALEQKAAPLRVTGVLAARPSTIADIDYDRDQGIYLSVPQGESTPAAEPRVYLQVDTDVSQTEIIAAVKQELTAINPAGNNLIVENPVGSLTAMRELQHAFSLSLLALTVLAVIATAAAVAALTLVQAKEMSRTLAVMRACGATKRHVCGAILREVLKLVVFVAVLGLVVGQVLFLGYAMANDLPLVRQYLPALLGSMVAIVFALVAAYLPARLMAEQPPAALL